jgi:Ca-activated chloride channel homolog
MNKVAWTMTILLSAPAWGQAPTPSAPPAAAPAAAGSESSPTWAERLLWNAEERTRRGLKASQAGKVDEAVERLDSAARLSENPTADYNAGTAHLLAGRNDAPQLLEKAAQVAPTGALAARSNYNLGNARFKAEDWQGAVESYKAALRQEPGFEDAKYNLELAMRKLQEQQQGQKDSKDQKDQKDQKDEQKQDQQKQDEQKQDQQKQDQQKQDQQNQDQQKQDQQNQQKQDQEQQDPQKQDPAQQQPEKEGPLPQFKDLPDMNAEQAAAILEAIENLEREQRREAAEKAVRVNARGKKDW